MRCMTNNPAGTRRRQIRTTQLVLAGAATVATLALFAAAHPAAAEAAPVGSQIQLAAPSVPGGGGFATDDGGVNDNGQTSGDIFTQNAQDQSTA
jgi:hypothetical protein